MSNKALFVCCEAILVNQFKTLCEAVPPARARSPCVADKITLGKTSMLTTKSFSGI